VEQRGAKRGEQRRVTGEAKRVEVTALVGATVAVGRGCRTTMRQAEIDCAKPHKPPPSDGMPVISRL